MMKSQTEAPIDITENMNDAAASDIFGDSSTDVALHRANPLMALGEVSGSVSASDFVFPRLKIAQRVGDLGQIFEPGALVLGNEIQLTTKDAKSKTFGPPVELIVLNLDKFFQDYLLYQQDGPRPAYYKNEAAVYAAGKTLEWTGERPDRIAPTAEPVAIATILVKKPDGLESGNFGVNIPGFGDCTLAKWTMTRTGYSRAGRRLIMARTTDFAQSNLMYGVWALNTKDEKINGNWVFTPALSLIRRNTPETVEAIVAAVTPS